MRDEQHTQEGSALPVGAQPIRRQLVVLFIVLSLGPLFVSNLWGYLQTRVHWAAAVEREVGHVARLAAEKVGDSLREKRAFVFSAVDSDRHLLSRMAAIRVTRPDELGLNLRDRLEAHLADESDGVPSLIELLIVSDQGGVVSSGRDDHNSWSMADACVVTHHEGGVRMGFHQEGSLPRLVVAADAATAAGTLLGTLCAVYDARHLERLLAESDPTEGTRAYLIDRDGRIVARSRDGEYGVPPSRSDDKPLVLGVPWSRRYEVGESAEVIAAYEPLAGGGWGVLVEVPVEEAFIGLETLKRQAVGLSGALALVLIVTISLAIRPLSRSIERLSAAAKRIAGGALGDSIPPTGPRELRELAGAFNQMSGALEQSHSLLEQRIAQRTAELRESQEFTELLFDSIHQRVLVVDASGLVVKANQTALDMHGAELVGRSYETVFAHGDDSSPVSRTFETGAPARAERPEEIDGRQEIVSLEAYPMFSASGEVNSVVEIGRFVTSEKHLQAQMIHSEKMAAFGLLAAGVAHEIGNPLAAIQSQLRVSRMSGDAATQTDTLEIVEREVQRVSRLLRELVDFARRRRDRVGLVSVNQVVQDVVRLIGHDPRAVNVEIIEKLTPESPAVRAREDHLTQVLLNLTINALDSMPDGGKLTVETSVANGSVAIQVRDTGTGIPDAARTSLFEPFFTTKEAGRGTGLGLFVSRAIVSDLGGELRLVSTSRDGTLFAFEIPMADVTRSSATR